MPSANQDTVDELTALVADDYPRDLEGANRTVRRFTIFSIIFSACPCAALACLALATARLGPIGAWSSGMLYLTYTLSSVLGATYVVKRLGGRNAMMLGMSLYVVYVACFWMAVAFPQIKGVSAISGAFIGGIGSGILWTAQGSYFTQAAEEHALYQGCEWADCTSSLSGTFASIYLLEETILHVSSYFLIQWWNVEWSAIFASYAAIAVASTVGMLWVKNYPTSRKRSDVGDSIWNKVMAALNLLHKDRKMRYLVGINMVFGFSGAFINSFVSGQVLRVALQDEQSKTVGLFVSWGAGVAALASLAFGKITHDYGKEPVMILGNVAFLGVSLPFVLQPDLTKWTWPFLLLVYAFQGLGRATFESTEKAVMADFFPYEKEGAFANIILQNGVFGSIGYILTFSLTCSTLGPYCIEYRNGTLHDVLKFEVLVCLAAVLAILGYLRANHLYWKERTARDSELKRYRVESISAYRLSQTGEAIESAAQYLAMEGVEGI
jgi:MFS family permease